MVEKVMICRVLYDFETEERGELTLHTDKYLQVLTQVNDDWLEGYCDGAVGSFPSAFVQQFPPITIPTNGKVFVCVEGFPELQAGDLAISAGDLITGLEPINADWWRGQLHGEVGIFPLTHVHEIQLKLSSPHPTQSPAVTVTRSSIGSRSDDVDQSQQTLYQVQAIMDAAAQLDGELSFSTGDVINVIKEQDSDWLIGSCNGETGMFLRDLTEPLGGAKATASSSSPTIAQHSLANLNPLHTVPADNVKLQIDATIQSLPGAPVSTSGDSHAQSVTGRVLYDFTAESNSELSLAVGQTVHSISHIDQDWSQGTCEGRVGMFPLVYIEIVTSNHTAVSQKRESIPEISATVLYDFNAVTDEEVSVGEGDKVTIVGADVDDWTKVKTRSGVEGLCPTSFLDTLVSDPSNPPSPQVQLNGFGSKNTLPPTSKPRPASLHSNQSLDDAISMEMSKAKKEAETSRRQSLRAKPTKPPTPQPILSQSTAAKLKPTRPPFSSQMVVVRNADVPKGAQIYDKLKEPFESQMEWKDEHASPVISIKPKKVPSKPPPPKRSTSSTGLSNSIIPQTKELLPAPAVGNNSFSNPLQLSDQQPITSHVSQEQPVTSHVLQEQPITSHVSQEQPVTSHVNTHQLITTHKPKEVVESRKTPPPEKPSFPPKPQVKEKATPETSGVLPTDERESETKAVSHTKTNISSAVNTLPDRDTQVEPVQSEEVVRKSPVPVRAAPPIPVRPAPSPLAEEVTRPTVLVPSRPAPSRPQPTRAAPPPPTRPAPAVPPEAAAYDEQAAAHLRERISILEQDIENYNCEVENLDGQSEEEGVIEERLRFYMENINGMTLEVDELKGKLSEMEESMKRESMRRASVISTNESRVPRVDNYNSKENVAKRREKRTKKIEELMRSEEFYLNDLRLCKQVFYSDSCIQAPDGVDTDALFSHISDIIAISEQLVAMLEENLNQVEFEKQLVGKPFVELKDRMSGVYALYCKNYDDVTQLLEQYKSNADIRSYFCQGLDEIAKQRAEKPFTIGAFLITPVQRIPRYILLLSEILEATEKGHPDREVLEHAKLAQQEVCDYTNEYKRRQDIVNKYKTSKENEDRLSKITMHSFKKKTQRVTRKIGHYVGLASQYVDKDFDREANYCKELENSIRDFAKNVDSVLSNLKKSHDVKEAVATDLSEYLCTPQPEEVKLYLSAQQKMSSTAFKLFKRDVDELVLTQLLKTQTLFQGPTKLIDKRTDKRYDYDAAHDRFERNREDKLASEEMIKAKKTFQALNTQLKEELPKFNRLVYEIFRDCISEFTRLYRTYYEKSYGLILPILQVTAKSDSPGIVEQFDKEYELVADILNMVTESPKSRKPSLNRKPSSATQQTGEVQNRVRTKYPSKIYTVISDYIPSDSMELKLSQGDIVGVIQQKDPMGNDNRWYVDSGVGAGFVQKSYLKAESAGLSVNLTNQSTSPQPASPCSPDGTVSPHAQSDNPSHLSPHQQSPQSYQQQQSPQPYQQQQSPQSYQQQQSPQSYQQQQSPQSYQQQQSPQSYQQQQSLPPPYESPPRDPAQPEVYRALYDFNRRNANEISLLANQIIHVHRKYDDQGNTQWWYAQSSEGYGYVPANYLTAQQP